MRPSNYTDEQIIAAGNELKNENPAKRITGHALSAKLGGGRPARLIEIWESYQADLRGSDELVQELPESLEFALESVLSTVKTSFASFLLESDKQIQDKASCRIEKEKVKFDEQMQILEEKLTDADQVINQNEDRIYSMSKELKDVHKLKNKIVGLEKVIIELQAKAEVHNNTIADKDRIINEQAARISELKAA
ncbi:DNA-binding protein [Thalassotalea sp. G2M2-11]|uniref:DNA-binding protein n=1 Tax=Thalassotalea sp. G2M2-11 TaxID=2787627 RepID=UPI0019D1627E|nr:DNA-binding protein [Thalassotalea sp. G2M2-11]